MYMTNNESVEKVPTRFLVVFLLKIHQKWPLRLNINELNIRKNHETHSPRQMPVNFMLGKTYSTASTT